jgi:hypothetical protein
MTKDSAHLSGIISLKRTRVLGKVSGIRLIRRGIVNSHSRPGSWDAATATGENFITSVTGPTLVSGMYCTDSKGVDLGSL